MSILASDVKFKKSVVINDTVSNGGKKGSIEVKSGVRHNLFPRVTKSERIAGILEGRLRKEFWCNENSSNETAYAMLAYLEYPSNAGDNFYIAKGTQTDTQSRVFAAATKPEYVFTGVGKLNTALTGAPTDTSVVVDMESNDYAFENGGTLHITNKFMVSQTLDSVVKTGDSVSYNGSLNKWTKISPSDDVTYPNGLCVNVTGSLVGTVMTNQPGVTFEEWLPIADPIYENEVLGVGDGVSKNITLTSLAHPSKICKQPNKRPVITYTISDDTTRTITFDGEGNVTSANATAGKLNFANGTWTTPIAFALAPKASSQIKITYYENCYSYAVASNTVTVRLAEAVGNAYSTANTYVGGCVSGGDVAPTLDGVVKNAAALTNAVVGNSSLIVLENKGTVEDDYTITFTGPNAFTVAGLYASYGTGTVSSATSPLNPDTGTPLFTIPSGFFSGTWAIDDTFKFSTHPAAVPLWLKEIVPAGTGQEPYNLAVLGWYCE